MADEFPDDLPIAPGVTVGDWKRGQDLKVDQQVKPGNDAKEAEAQLRLNKLLDKAKGARVGREMSHPRVLDAARAEQKLKDQVQGPREDYDPRTIEADRRNYNRATTYVADSNRMKIKKYDVPGKVWANADGKVYPTGDGFTSNVTHRPGQDIMLEQADQLYDDPARREKALTEWQRERDKQEHPMTNAGAKAAKGMKRVRGLGGASPEEGSGGESDVATVPNFQASRPGAVGSNVVQQAAPQNHKSSVFGTLAGVGLGLGTGNWAPLATHILGSGAGSAVGAATGGQGQDPTATQTSKSEGDSSKTSGSGEGSVQPQAQGVQGMENYIPLLAHMLGQKVATIMQQGQGGGFGGAPLPGQQQPTPSPLQYQYQPPPSLGGM